MQRNTFLESLKHTDQPWVGLISGVLQFIKNGLSLLCLRCTMFEMAPKRSESNFGWQPFFSSSWQTFYSKTLQFYYVKLTSHNF